jgi:flavin reductase ActVB
MARLSSHVTIVTAYDAWGQPRGFTASSVCSLSLNPPLLLVCVSRKGASHGVFTGVERFAVNFLREEHADVAMQFATPDADRFSRGEFVDGPYAPVLPEALAVMSCARYATHPGGDHTILVGHVDKAAVGAGRPLVYFERDFRCLDLWPVAIPVQATR